LFRISCISCASHYVRASVGRLANHRVFNAKRIRSRSSCYFFGRILTHIRVRMCVKSILLPRQMTSPRLRPLLIIHSRIPRAIIFVTHPRYALDVLDLSMSSSIKKSCTYTSICSPRSYLVKRISRL